MAAPIHMTPRGGLAHPVFEGGGPGDQILCAYAFEPALDEAGLERARQILDAWSESAARAEASEPVHCDEPFLSPRALRIRVHNLQRPAPALEELTRHLAAAVALREAHHSRWRALPEREEPAPVLDPNGPEELTQFASHAAYLGAVFDLAGPPPASEYEGFGQAAFETRAGDIVLEDRGMPLHLPPLRICYGTGRAEFRPADAQAAKVRDALTASVAQTFAELANPRVPRFFDHAGALGQLDRLHLGNRDGFGFAFASPELVQRLANTRFRYREHELFEALAATVEAVGLSPVVTWQRFGKPFAKSWKSLEVHVFQLWERA